MSDVVCKDCGRTLATGVVSPPADQVEALRAAVDGYGGSMALGHLARRYTRDPAIVVALLESLTWMAGTGITSGSGSAGYVPYSRPASGDDS